MLYIFIFPVPFFFMFGMRESISKIKFLHNVPKAIANSLPGDGKKITFQFLQGCLYIRHKAARIIK